MYTQAEEVRTWLFSPFSRISLSKKNREMKPKFHQQVFVKRKARGDVSLESFPRRLKELQEKEALG